MFLASLLPLLFCFLPFVCVCVFCNAILLTYRTDNQYRYPISDNRTDTRVQRERRNLQQLLLCATQSLFTCDTQQAGQAQANGSSPTSIQV